MTQLVYPDRILPTKPTEETFFYNELIPAFLLEVISESNIGVNMQLSPIKKL